MSENVGLRTTIFAGERVRIGLFRARPNDALFSGSGPTRACIVVFPRAAVRIAQSGRDALIADPTRVVFYNARQEYTRATISPEGDRSDWIAFSERDLADAIAPYDPRVEDRVAAPFALTHGPCDSRVLASQRALVEDAKRGARSAFEIESRALGILGDVIRTAYLSRGAKPRRARSRMRHRALAEDARALLATRFTEALSVQAVADALDVSAFHLCRVFRRETGCTLHASLGALRLHHAHERVLSGEPNLTRLALDLGYASHSHFTSAFTRAFGAPPTRARALTGEAIHAAKRARF